jgi:hypothetical protein
MAAAGALRARALCGHPHHPLCVRGACCCCCCWG